MKLTKYMVMGAVALTMGLSSCVDDLNVEPENPTTKTELTSKEDYLGVIARTYGGLVLEGGVQVNDGGRAVYTRLLWNLQELSADEAIVGDNWKDAGLPEVKYNNAGPDCAMLYEAYSRFNYQIALCNETLRVLNNAGEFFSAEEIDAFRREMRVLRALSYYYIIDIFGTGPWTDENSVVGEIPPTYTRKQLFDAVVADLNDAVPGMKPASQQVYGRVSREAGYMLLAKLYLNAEVYTGQAMWGECAAACQEIVKTINTLAPEYKYLFCATNDKYVGNGEIIWAVPQDENTLQTYGGTTYLAIGCYNADVVAKFSENGQFIFGLEKGPWGGPRVRPELSQALDHSDKRRLIYEGELNENVDNLQDWKIDGDGYMCIKYVYTPETNYYNDGNTDTAPDCFNSADYPLFRLADVYLMLAECDMHGTSCNGLYYFNEVRKRAGLATVNSYSADDLLKERMCELYWEGHRRSDLIRFGKYTGNNYNWSWKGGVLEGVSIPEYRSLYAIPVQFESTLGQNPGYPRTAAQ